MNCEEVEDLIAAYALGALPADALSEIGEHLASCANHPEAADFRAVASSLAFAAPEAEPSPALKTRLMNAIGEEATEPAMAQQRRGLGWLRGIFPQRAVPYALAGALALAVAALIATNVGDSDERDRFTVTLAGANDASAVLHVVEDGIVVMEADGLQPLDDDQTYQVWSIAAGQPASLGLLGRAPEGEALGALRADLAGVDTVAVTIEPAGGSIAPTSDPVLATEEPLPR